MLRFTTYALCFAALLFAGCRTDPPVDYNRPLPPGAFGLRKITNPADLPDLRPAVSQIHDPGFEQARQRSLKWFGYPSTQQFYPVGPIGHTHARTSLFALGQVQNIEQLLSEFDVWESVGWNGHGEVLYTGYFSPEFTGSRTPQGQYRYPLYKRPTDLLSDPATGQVRGRQTAAGVVPYPTRREIEQSNMLAGGELVYLASPLDVYIVQVNGSARIDLAEGGVMYVGYAGTNGMDYTSIRELMVNDGKLDPEKSGLPAIRQYFRQNPAELDRYVQQNDRFVFFDEYKGDNWPAGSLGFKVTPMRSLATDKAIFPRGSVVFAQTTIPTTGGPNVPFNQLMLDQDTGGAIRAAGRADIYIGIGNQAEALAGRQAATGRMYYLLLKPHRIQYWADQMGLNTMQGAR